MSQRLAFCAGLGLLASFLPSCAQAQNPFLQSPTYPGGGNSVFVADFNHDGKPDILTADGTLNLGSGDGTFGPGTALSGTILAVADFNGDGKPDVLEQGTGTLLVLLGNGDGTFGSAISTASGASLTSIVAADLNGDGKADVVGVSNGMLLVYLSKGDGTLAPGVSYPAAASAGGTLLSLGDFNGDHKVDIALSIAGNNVAGQEIVFLGNGDGTFQPAKTSPGVFYPAFAAVGDFDGDGKTDLAVSIPTYCNGSCSIPASVYILRGSGDGTFQAPVVAFPGNGPIVAADLNGDGKLDLFLEGDPTVGLVYLGNGDGTFSNTRSYFLNAVPHSGGIAMGDFNLDGKPDIAAGSTVLLSNGDGSFQGVQFGVIPDLASAAIVAGTFDKAGAPAVALLSNQQLATGFAYNVYILSNDGKGALSLAHTYALQAPGYAIVAADFNGDGNLDLVVFSSGQSTNLWGYSVLLGNGDGTFQSPVFYQQNATSNQVFSIVVGDFNNDHKLDLVVDPNVGSPGENTFAYLQGNGDGTFAAPVDVFDGGGKVVGADFNGDGKLDIAAGLVVGAGAGIGQTLIVYGNGDGTFQPAVFPVSLTSCPRMQFTADLNNDGVPDLVCQSQVALGIGGGTFTVLPLFPSNVTVDGVADLNGDGKPDLLVTYYGASGHPSQSAILLGNGDGTFGAPINVPPAGVLPLSGVVADMNGDGRPDVIFPWSSAVDFPSVVAVNGVAVMLNSFAPNFAISATALSPVIVAPGNSANSTVSISSTAGFSGTVALSCLGVPSGATCRFSPNSVNSAGTATLAIATTSSTPLGTYPITIAASAPSLTNTTVVTLTVATSAGATTINLAPSSLTFAPQASGTSGSPRTVQLTNTGRATLSIFGISISGANAGDFRQTNTCTSALAVGASCQISVVFTPTNLGARTASVSVADNATGSPQMVALSGAGPDFSLSTGSTTTASVTPGQTATYNIGLTPTDAFNQMVTLSCSGAPAHSMCSISPTAISLNGSSASSATVTVTTTAGSRLIPVSLPVAPSGIGSRLQPLLIGLLVALLVVAVDLRRRGPQTRWATAAGLGVLLCIGGMLTSCGGGSSSSSGPSPSSTATPVGTYTITVSASASSGSVTLTHETQLTLVVQ
jgi:hypothetical protein